MFRSDTFHSTPPDYEGWVECLLLNANNSDQALTGTSMGLKFTGVRSGLESPCQ